MKKTQELPSLVTFPLPIYLRALDWFHAFRTADGPENQANRKP